MGRRFAAGAAVGTALVVSLTGCLGDTGSGGQGSGKSGGGAQLTAAQVLLRSSEKTGNADTFKAAISMNAQMPGQGGPMTMHGTMRYRSRPQVAFSMNFDRINAGGQAMPGGMQVVLLGRAMYMRIPTISQMTHGKPWIKVSLDELSKRTGQSFDQLLQQTQQMDPVQNTKMLTASKDVHKVGTEVVDGVRTTHYAGTYSLQEALSKLDAKTRQQIQKSYDQLGMDKMDFDVWVDGQQLPRKLVMKSPPGSKVQMTETMLYRDFGKPVHISAPPASEVSNLSDLTRNAGGAGV